MLVTMTTGTEKGSLSRPESKASFTHPRFLLLSFSKEAILVCEKKYMSRAPVHFFQVSAFSESMGNRVSDQNRYERRPTRKTSQ